MTREARRGLTLAPFNALSDPRLLADLAARAERRGWDGIFLWDHIVYSPPASASRRPVGRDGRDGDDDRADPARPDGHAAGAPAAPEALPRGGDPRPPQRRPADPRAGTGPDRHGELSPFGDPSEPKELARRLDDTLEKLPRWWSGELEPVPLQQPRIPIWLAGRYPNRRPLRRAADWEGYFVIDLPDPDALAELAAELPGPPFELVTDIEPGDDPQPWVDAGATWVLTSFGPDPDPDAVRGAIAAGP